MDQKFVYLEGRDKIELGDNVFQICEKNIKHVYFVHIKIKKNTSSVAKLLSQLTHFLYYRSLTKDSPYKERYLAKVKDFDNLFEKENIKIYLIGIIFNANISKKEHYQLNCINQLAIKQNINFRFISPNQK